MVHIAINLNQRDAYKHIIPGLAVEALAKAYRQAKEYYFLHNKEYAALKYEVLKKKQGGAKGFSLAWTVKQHSKIRHR